MRKALICVGAWALLLVAMGCTQSGVMAPRNVLKGPRRLNNFVTELVRIENAVADGGFDIAFDNPREGWVFFRAEGTVGRAGGLALALGAAGDADVDVVLALRTGGGIVAEGMRYLPSGMHAATLRQRDVALKTLSIRTMPVLRYATINYPCYIERMGRYDPTWLKRIGMLDNCNTLVTSEDAGYLSAGWLAQGRHIVAHAGVPGLRHNKAPVTEESAYQYWMNHPALNRPELEGAVVDEFYMSEPVGPHLPALIPAILRVLKDKPDKAFHAYLGDDFPPRRTGNARILRPFVEPLAKAGCYFALERYLQEKPTERDAREYIEAALVNEMREFRTYAPDFQKQCVFVMGFMNAASLNMDHQTNANMKVWLDMQFHALATNPVFDGLMGIEEYLSGYCDEELLRWCVRLFRHYGVEGRTDRLCDDPYETRHIVNGDFREGLKGWRVSAAAADSVQARVEKDYGDRIGLYARNGADGDAFLWMKRQEETPNIVSQEIRNLEPGRFYSVKMLVGRHDLPTHSGRRWAWIEVEGAEKVPSQLIQGMYSAKSDDAQKRFGQAETFFTWHRTVFRATAPTAVLKIYDWYRPAYRKGPAGEETAVSLVQVEPYLMPDMPFDLQGH